ncbi:hypothetical protein F4777DRAFT_564657 [Nemania sp. FL0916]|nr:hypothetical protein F4777DRAFT_564657 [Nemania sp. FL0916]
MDQPVSMVIHQLGYFAILSASILFISASILSRAGPSLCLSCLVCHPCDRPCPRAIEIFLSAEVERRRPPLPSTKSPTRHVGGLVMTPTNLSRLLLAEYSMNGCRK